jgi:predicted GNAT superfamily acetyltransferase
MDARSSSRTTRLPDGTEIVIREATGGDLDDLCQHYQALAPEHHELRFPPGSRRVARDVERAIGGRSVVLVAFSPDGELIGEAVCWLLPYGRAQLDWSVASARHEPGVERALAHAIQSHARRVGANRVVARVLDTEDNRSWFKGEGWELSRADEHVCIYHRNLDPHDPVD